MGKKKSNKKVETKTNINEVEMKDSLKKKIIVVVIVLACIGLFYFLAVYLTNNDTSSVENNDKDVEAVIDYDMIIFGESFNKSGEYYVVYYDGSDESITSSITSAVSPYRAAENTLNVYEVDMSSSFNSAYITSEETNKSPSNLDELRINGPTLIKFNNGSVVDYIEGIENIENTLEVEDESTGE